jgi:ectoine hydroxylase-related dioxygenase (phytanoyl-CoA dioxygenase family)
MSFLTTEQIAAFKAEGFLVLRQFLDPEVSAALARSSRALLDTDAVRQRPESRRVWHLYRHGEDFIDLITEPRLLALVEQLLGPGTLVSDFSLNAVSRNDPPHMWHVDYPYNEMSVVPRGGMFTIQCVFPMTSFTHATGATKLVPGSHLRCSRPAGEPSDETIAFEGEPGDMLVLGAPTWHSAGRNTTDEPRIAILANFVEPWIRPMTGPVRDQGPWTATAQLRLMLGVTRPYEEETVPESG